MSTPGGRNFGRAKSCVVCRQFKLACDARRTAPNPCSRCVNKNLTCRFDPNFKRISTRKYVAEYESASFADQTRIAQEVADELHTLRAAQYADPTSRSSENSHSHLLVGGQSPASFQESSRKPASSVGSSLVQHASDPSRPHCVELAEDELVVDQTIHGVTVSSSSILKLFYQYAAPSFTLRWLSGPQL